MRLQGGRVIKDKVNTRMRKKEGDTGKEKRRNRERGKVKR